MEPLYGSYQVQGYQVGNGGETVPVFKRATLPCKQPPIAGDTGHCAEEYKIVIFIDGCFWHGYEGCKCYRLPKTNVDFWRYKIAMNIARDYSNNEDLKLAGWRVIRILECEIKTRTKRNAALETLYIDVISKTTKNNQKWQYRYNGRANYTL